MVIYIKSVIGAVMHEPERPTHVISIFSSLSYLNVYHKLVEDPLFEVHRYQFDDISLDSGYGKLFTPEIAQDIITDYAEARAHCPDVLVHCTYGRNRSPAVGIALNNIFGLGYSSWGLKQQFPDYNRWIYNVMMAAGREIRQGRRKAQGLEAAILRQ
ncbi:hypothetical protein KY363_06595 [Candidatus Woesearchaeota archaeon]|nr:hypothetical protein [Candidatus Woesearchaeota archaeon]